MQTSPPAPRTNDAPRLTRAFATMVTALRAAVVSVILLNCDSDSERRPAPSSADSTSPAPTQVADAAMDGEGEGPTPLFVPLERTVAERARFVAEYRKADRLHARPLYEGYLDSIGANGLIASISRVVPYCHAEGHELGRLFFSRLRDVGDALRTCQDACFSGCMHGVVTEFFADAEIRRGGAGGGAAGLHAGHDTSMAGMPSARRVTDETMRANIPSVCAGQTLSAMYRPGDCAHGVGHAAMFLSQYHIGKALGYCDIFDSYAMRYYCATGAYMELETGRLTAATQRASPLSPCDRSPYPAACFRHELTLVVPDHYSRGGTLAQLGAMCMSLQGKYRLGCLHGLGNAHMSQVRSGRLKIADLCSFGGRPEREVCIEGAIERIAKYAPAIARRRCAELLGWERQVCDASTERKMYDLKRSFALYQK